MPFSLEADVPDVWECTVCGAEALRMDGTRPEPKKGKPARTHWDMLLERRSVKELEVLLAERLEHLRSGPAAKAAHERPDPAQERLSAPAHDPTSARVASLPPGDAARLHVRGQSGGPPIGLRAGVVRRAAARPGRPRRARSVSR